MFSKFFSIALLVANIASEGFSSEVVGPNILQNQETIDTTYTGAKDAKNVGELRQVEVPIQTNTQPIIRQKINSEKGSLQPLLNNVGILGDAVRKLHAAKTDSTMLNLTNLELNEADEMLEKVEIADQNTGVNKTTQTSHDCSMIEQFVPPRSLKETLQDILKTKKTDLSKMENALVQFLEDFPEFEPVITKLAEIHCGLSDVDEIGINKYVKPKSFMNVCSVLSGLCVDTTKIVASYLASQHWLGSVIVILSTIDGVSSAYNNHIDSRVQQGLNKMYDKDYTGQKISVDGDSNRERVTKYLQSINSAYSLISNYYRRNSSFYDQETNDIIEKHLKDAAVIAQNIKSLALPMKRLDTAMKVSTFLSSCAVGLVGSIFGTGTTETSVVTTVSTAISAISNRISGVKQSTKAANIIFLTGELYCKLCGILEAMDQKK